MFPRLNREIYHTPVGKAQVPGDKGQGNPFLGNGMGHVNLTAFEQYMRGESGFFKADISNVPYKAAVVHEHEPFRTVKGQVGRFSLYIVAGSPFPALGFRNSQQDFAFMEDCVL